MDHLIKVNDSDFYIKINGERFIDARVLNKIAELNGNWLKNLFSGKISMKEYKEKLFWADKVVHRAIRFTKTKNKFLNELISHNVSVNDAKKQWKHEREHYAENQRRGLNSRIGVLHINYGEGKLQLQPSTIVDLSEALNNWSLEEFKVYMQTPPTVTKPSEGDLEMGDFAKRL